MMCVRITPPRRLAACGLALLLAGCAGDKFSELNQEPRLSPLGHGLERPSVYFPPTAPNGSAAARSFNSTWGDGRTNYVSDARAARVGDVIRVEISINDKASLDNRSDRKRDSGVEAAINFMMGNSDVKKDGTASWDMQSNTRSKGEGTIDRSEEIKLNVAAVVVDVLPNGNLVISGSQEVRVNFEVRVLRIAGIVRPRDITGDNNTVTYDKIAEARISYGGRGRLTEVQQPGWAQQVYDVASPF